jgi:PilZ domain
MSRYNLKPSGFEARRAERLSVNIKASLRKQGTTKFDVEMHDLSMTGFRFETAFTLPEGTSIWLTIPGLGGLEAKIAWRRDFLYGASFVNPLYPAVFDHIAKQFAKRSLG